MRCKWFQCSPGPSGFLAVVMATTLMTVSAVSVHDVNIPKLANYEVEEAPHIEYSYVVYNLVPKEGVWWKRGTHRMRPDKANMAAASDDNNGVAERPAAIVNAL